MLDDEHFPADQADVVGPPGEQDCEHGRDRTASQRRRNGEREDEAREGKEDVRETQDERGDHAADRTRSVPIARDQTEDSSEECGETRDGKADREVQRQRREDPREDIPPQVVGSEQVL